MEMLTPFFGLFTSFILFYYRKDFNRSNLYLALFFLCSNLIVLVYFGLHFSKNPFWEGVFFINFMPLSFVIGPLLFYYVKYAVAEDKNISPKDYLHLIPALLVIIYSLPYTTLDFSNPKIGTYIIKVKQDGTGGRTLTFPIMKWADAAVPTITTAANAIDLITLIYDGTHYYGSCLQNF